MSKSNLYLGDCLSNPAILAGCVVILNEVTREFVQVDLISSCRSNRGSIK